MRHSGTVAAAVVVAVAVVVAAVAVRRPAHEDVTPRDETAALVQTWWRHTVSATAYVRSCRRTGRMDRRFSAPVYACTIRSPGSSYRRSVCVSVEEHVVWRRLACAARG